MDNLVFDFIIGEVSEVRKFYDLNLEWEFVFVVEIR